MDDELGYRAGYRRRAARTGVYARAFPFYMEKWSSAEL